MMPKISFIKSDDRQYNIERCLSLLKSEIIAGLKNAKNVVIKPNCVVDNVQLACTHKDALEALLKFISPYIKGQVTLAEGSGVGDTIEAFKNYGYLELQENYDIALVDLNKDDFETIDLLFENGKEWKAQIAKTILNSDYLISVSPPKTHDAVVYTGAVKNVSVGSLIRGIPSFSKTVNKLKDSMGLKKNNKALIHQGPAMMNKNIAKIFKHIPLKLAVLDAFESMQGNGPVNGEMVPSHFAIASSDPIAADWLACQLMGISIDDVGYLSMIGAGTEEYFIIGDDWEKNITNFKLHEKFEEMRKWK